MGKTEGYSGTPLERKLGFKPGMLVRLVHAPGNYFALFAQLPDMRFHEAQGMQNHCIHIFTKERRSLEMLLPQLRNEIVPDGMIWVSWPKKTSRITTDITGDTIRGCALRNGLVDVKVCAVDAVWSALKLVIPLKDRAHKK